MGEDFIHNPQLHRPCSKELGSQVEDDLIHHIRNVYFSFPFLNRFDLKTINEWEKI